MQGSPCPLVITRLPDGTPSDSPVGLHLPVPPQGNATRRSVRWRRNCEKRPAGFPSFPDRRGRDTHDDRGQGAPPAKTADSVFMPETPPLVHITGSMQSGLQNF